MSLFEVYQSQPVSITVSISDVNDGTPRLGLLWDQIVVQYAKNAASPVLTTKTLLSGDEFEELGNGLYKLDFVAAELDTLGPFIFTINGIVTLAPQIKQYQKEILVVEDPGTSPAPITLAINKITGTILHPTGQPRVNIPVVANILRVPKIIGGAAISSDSVATRTDADGYFEMELIQGAKVEFVIPNADLRRTVIIPATGTSDLFAIPST